MSTQDGSLSDSPDNDSSSDRFFTDFIRVFGECLTGVQLKRKDRIDGQLYDKMTARLQELGHHNPSKSKLQYKWAYLRPKYEV